MRWHPTGKQARTTAATALAVLAWCGCHRVQEDGPGLDAGGGGYVADIGAELAIDVPYFDTIKEVSKVDAADAATAPKEQCNKVDDDGDGLIDEDGCFPAPNVREGAHWVDLGLVELSKIAAPAPTRTINVPGKNAGVALYAEDVSQLGDALLWLETLVAPGGVEFASRGLWVASPNRAYASFRQATALIGMTPAVGVVGGPWQVGFTRAVVTPQAYKGTPVPGWLRLGALVRAEIPANTVAALDLDVVCVGGVPMPCTELGKTPHWQEIIKRVNAIWKVAGVQIGKVDMVDLGGDDGEKFKIIDNFASSGGDNELTQVYEAAGKLRPKSTAATLVLVGGLTHKGDTAAGLSQLAGLPGLVGSRAAGLAVVVDPTDWAKAVDPAVSPTYAGDVWGLVIAHEIGHFLGLWHTDESNGALHDVIDDTPQCDKKVDLLTQDECPVQAKYLMFWKPKGAAITAGQTKVTRLSPALRPAGP